MCTVKDENILHIADIRILRWIRSKTRKRPCQKPGHTRGCQSLPNVNILETEKIELVWTHQEKRIRQPLKTNDGHGCTREEKKGAG